MMERQEHAAALRAGLVRAALRAAGVEPETADQGTVARMERLTDWMTRDPSRTHQWFRTLARATQN
jgi:hypothetical protein